MMDSEPMDGFGELPDIDDLFRQQPDLFPVGRDPSDL